MQKAIYTLSSDLHFKYYNLQLQTEKLGTTYQNIIYASTRNNIGKKY